MEIIAAMLIACSLVPPVDSSAELKRRLTRQCTVRVLFCAELKTTKESVECLKGVFND